MQVGFFGKLPGVGDFIQRNVSPDVIIAFENWIYPAFEKAKYDLGEKWRECYFSSPIWRFVLPAGIWSQQVISGFMMPSIDRSGRCFPFVLVCEAEADVNPILWSVCLDQYHSKAEELALSLLELPNPDLDGLSDCFGKIYKSASEIDGLLLSDRAMKADNEIFTFNVPSDSWLTSHLNTLYLMMGSEVNYWWTNGGINHQPVMRYFRGLPHVNSFSTFISCENN